MKWLLLTGFILAGLTPQPTLAEESFAERDFAAKKQVFGIKYPWQMITPYADSLSLHQGTMMIINHPRSRLEPAIPSSNAHQDPAEESIRFQFPPNIWRTQHSNSEVSKRPIVNAPALMEERTPLNSGDPPAYQNSDHPRLINGVDSLYERLPKGGFRDLRDGSIWDEIPNRPMGNIAAYRKNLLNKILDAWRPTKPGGPIVAITISNHGALITCELIQSSGSKGVDRRALQAIWFTRFESLPEWFKGEQLTFKINMAALADTALDR